MKAGAAVTHRYEFASDNTAGVCPEAWDALARANADGCLPSYGEDPWTARAADGLRETFETDCEVFFLFNGTAANSLALAQLCAPFHAVVAHNLAHVEQDECGAPGFFTGGAQLILVDGPGGKVTPAAVARALAGRRELHSNKPRALTLTQSTELGAVYTPEEVGALGELARAKGLRVHMDGARFANAVAALGCAPAEVTWRAGVDVLTLGGTKNGLAMNEAVVFFDKELAADFDYRVKQGGQLASKMRYLAAPFVGSFGTGAWLRHATHANTCAWRLATALRTIPGLRLLNDPPEANAVFVEIPDAVAADLRARGWHFYKFIGERGYRLMCSWATRPEDVAALAADCRAAAAAGSVGE